MANYLALVIWLRIVNAAFSVLFRSQVLQFFFLFAHNLCVSGLNEAPHRRFGLRRDAVCRLAFVLWLRIAVTAFSVFIGS